MATIIKNKTLKDLGEAGIIRLVQGKVSPQLSPYIRKGIGDDCAVLETAEGKLLLVTTDTLIEGVHFTAQTLSPEALGWKALAVNISDIAAMGGVPRTAFLSIALRPDSGADFLESFTDGLKALADKTGIVLAGGDTVESPSDVMITITLLGDCPPEHLVYRSGAKVGDDVWVTGQLGNAAAGLFLLMNKKVSEVSGYKLLVQAHQEPMPLVEMGRALGESGLVHAMIDISDGIAKDLGHICQQSATGALLQATSIPMSDELLKLAAEAEKNPLSWALHGGEDYELLFTGSSVDEEKILSLTSKVLGTPAAKIGTITRDENIWLQTEKGKEPIQSGGYVHF